MPDSEIFVPYVPEDKTRLGSFTALWPHRWDWIWAAPVNPGDKPKWHTESKFPLSDRQIEDPSKLLGVRFGSETCYLMLDIDRGSPYHPRRDPLALGRIKAALESLDLVDCVIVSSSYSGGIHVYFPWFGALPSWQIAGAAEYFLNRRGFLIQPGILELFPNPRPWVDGGEQGMFNGHRLPMQSGSYILDKDFCPMWSERETFVKHWERAALRNAPRKDQVKWAAEKSQTRRKRSLTFKAQKFLNDLNQDIEPGWTARGQTNALIGRLALRAYVFGEVLGYDDDLAQTIYHQALGLPGFEDYCSHKIDLLNRCEDWALCVQKSPRYYPYGKPRLSKRVDDDQPETTWNTWQEQRARDRIRFAIACHLNRGTWPARTSDRLAALMDWAWDEGGGFSFQTLYRHADLWHPEHIGGWVPEPVENLKSKKENPKGAGPGGAAPFGQARNLLSDQGVNPDGERDRGLEFWQGWFDTGCNTALDAGLSDFQPKQGRDPGD